ncbi:hypothetical protein EYC84_005445 [Monilinia fructicola]|uniref:Uncharacterized protein n=1 Tax=Monilinia fructicola TaxID=38448 RepID=A0A5M9JZ16_MONFR|nr:hypothetical protein EYC84_005445 [Monilinia fructicola]
MLYPFHSQLVNFSIRQRWANKNENFHQIHKFYLSHHHSSPVISLSPPSSVKGFIHLSEQTHLPSPHTSQSRSVFVWHPSYIFTGSTVPPEQADIWAYIDSLSIIRRRSSASELRLV